MEENTQTPPVQQEAPVPKPIDMEYAQSAKIAHNALQVFASHYKTFIRTYFHPFLRNERGVWVICFSNVGMLEKAINNLQKDMKSKPNDGKKHFKKFFAAMSREFVGYDRYKSLIVDKVDENCLYMSENYDIRCQTVLYWQIENGDGSALKQPMVIGLPPSSTSNNAVTPDTL